MLRTLSFCLGFFLCLSSIEASTSPKLIIIRHAQAHHNIKHTYNSNPNHKNYQPSYLTSTGEKEVAETARELKEQGINAESVHLTLVSPLPRALQTASLLAEEGALSRNTIVIEPRLTEAHMGENEGETYPLDPKIKKKLGESGRQIRNRVSQLLKEIRMQSIPGDVVVITHDRPSSEIYRLMTGQNKHFNTAEIVILPRDKTRFLTYE